MIQGTRKKEDEFNKDAGMYVCKAGHMSIRRARMGTKGVKVILTILILKNTRHVHSKLDVTKKVRKVKRIL